MTHEEEARLLFNKYVFLGGDGFFYIRLNDDDSFVNAIATTLRKRDELYDAAWRECKQRRGPRFSVVEIEDATNAHDTLRREAGKEKA